MPEGDTIHALAGAMGRELTGRPLTALELRGRPPEAGLVGRPIGRVWARGKNLFVGVDGEAALWVHLGMYGRWNRYRGDDRRGRRLGAAGVRIGTDRASFLCFGPKTAELLRRRDVDLHPSIASLGPDLIAVPVDWSEVLRRARARLAGVGRPSVRELLLEQRVAAGIGNIFQAETLFLERLHPDADAAHLDDERLVGLYRRASDLLIANVGAVPRVFTAGRSSGGSRGADRDRTWVYGRAGRPCRVCEAPIVRRGESADDRVTWWCPQCQPAPTVQAPLGATP